MCVHRLLLVLLLLLLCGCVLTSEKASIVGKLVTNKLSDCDLSFCERNLSTPCNKIFFWDQNSTCFFLSCPAGGGALCDGLLADLVEKSAQDGGHSPVDVAKRLPAPSVSPSPLAPPGPPAAPDGAKSSPPSSDAPRPPTESADPQPPSSRDTAASLNPADSSNTNSSSGTAPPDVSDPPLLNSSSSTSTSLNPVDTSNTSSSSENGHQKQITATAKNLQAPTAPLTMSPGVATAHPDISSSGNAPVAGTNGSTATPESKTPPEAPTTVPTTTPATTSTTTVTRSTTTATITTSTPSTRVTAAFTTTTTAAPPAAPTTTKPFTVPKPAASLTPLLPSTPPLTSARGQTPSPVTPETPENSSVGQFPNAESKEKEHAGQAVVEAAGEPLTSHVVNTSALLAVLMFGLLFFVVTVILFLRHAYESYRRKDYTQVDYLINGMYSDSGV